MSTKRDNKKDGEDISPIWLAKIIFEVVTRGRKLETWPFCHFLLH